jgi:hypothetical protein
VAIVSSAGLVVRGENPFRGRDADYRSIRADTKPGELLVSRSPSAVPGAGVERDWHTLADDYRRRARIGADSIPNTKIDIVAAGFAELGGHLQL